MESVNILILESKSSHRISEREVTFLMLGISIQIALYISVFLKVTKTELEKLKSSYRQLIKEVNSAKEKYKEAVAKGMCLTWVNLIYFLLPVIYCKVMLLF